MQETYTFSRALHLMRYGGKKMKRATWSKNFWCAIEFGELFFYDIATPHIKTKSSLNSDDIMGSWVEVKN